MKGLSALNCEPNDVIVLNFMKIMNNGGFVLAGFTFTVIEWHLQPRGYAFIMIHVMHIPQVPSVVAMGWKHGQKKEIFFTAGLRKVMDMCWTDDRHQTCTAHAFHAILFFCLCFIAIDRKFYPTFALCSTCSLQLCFAKYLGLGNSWQGWNLAGTPHIVMWLFSSQQCFSGREDMLQDESGTTGWFKRRRWLPFNDAFVGCGSWLSSHSDLFTQTFSILLASYQFLYYKHIRHKGYKF